MTTAQKTIKVENVTKTYIRKRRGRPDTITNALNGVTFELPRTGLIGITGKIGSGKSTLLHIIGGLDTPTSGSVLYNDENISKFTDTQLSNWRGENVGFLSQSLTTIPYQTVYENIGMALLFSTSPTSMTASARDKAIRESAKNAGLEERHLYERFEDLSSGESKKAQFAMAIAKKPKIFLLDEPATGLDPELRMHMIKQIKAISKVSLVIWVSHYWDLVAEYADRIIELNDGKIVADRVMKKPQSAVDRAQELVTADQTFDIISNKRHHIPITSHFMNSLKSLYSRKFSTIFLSLVSSIGIAALALLLAVSNGFSNQIKLVVSREIGHQPIMIGSIYEGDKTHINIIDDDVSKFANGLTDNTNVNFVWQKSVIDMHLLSRNGIIDEVFTPMPNIDQVKQNYTRIAGAWPDTHDEIFNPDPTSPFNIMLVVGADGKIPATVLSNLGIGTVDRTDMLDFLYKYSDPILPSHIEIVPNNFYYRQSAGGFFGKYTSPDYYKRMWNETHDVFDTETDTIIQQKFDRLNITGVIQATSTIDYLPVGLVYTNALYEYMQNIEKTSDVAQAQYEKYYGIVSGIETGYSVLDDATTEAVNNADKQAHLKHLGAIKGVCEIYTYVKNITGRDFVLGQIKTFNKTRTGDYVITPLNTESSYVQDLENVKTAVEGILVGITIIALSSSLILLFGLYYQSVRARTREIGTVRALGARKFDVSIVFNIEFTIIGFLAWAIGLGINLIFNTFTNKMFGTILHESGNVVQLAPWILGVTLITSIGMSLLGGSIPRRLAVRKQPVDAFKM